MFMPLHMHSTRLFIRKLDITYCTGHIHCLVDFFVQFYVLHRLTANVTNLLFSRFFREHYIDKFFTDKSNFIILSVNKGVVT